MSLEAGRLPDNSILDGRYSIIRFLGEGGLAYSYLAYPLNDPSKKVVIKQTRRLQHLTDEISEDRFQMEREFRLLQELHNPRIPRPVEMFEIGNILYFVREYRQGQVLDDLIKKGLKQRQIESICWQILETLEYLHEHGIIYRDLKPSNILVDKDGQVCLFDFGTARFYKQGKQGDTIALGTPGFAAPEQYGRAQTSETSDIYSFGAVLYYMLTKENPEENPFTFGNADNINATIENIRLANILLTCLTMRPEERFQNVLVLRETLYSPQVFQLPMSETRSPLVSPSDSQVQKSISTHFKIGIIGLILAVFGVPFFLSITVLIPSPDRNYCSKCQVHSPAGKDCLGEIPLSPGEGSYNENLYKKNLELGLLYLKAKKFEEALPYLNKAISFNQTSSKAYEARGEAYQQLKETDKALADFERCVHLAPNNLTAYQNMGLIHQQTGDHVRAIDEFSRVLIAKQDPAILSLRANSYCATGLFNYALNDIEEIEKITPKKHKVYLQKAQVYMLQGDYKAGLEANARAKKLIYNTLDEGGQKTQKIWLGILANSLEETKFEMSRIGCGETYQLSGDLDIAIMFIHLAQDKDITDDEILTDSCYENNPGWLFLMAVHKKHAYRPEAEVRECVNRGISYDRDGMCRMWFISAAKHAKDIRVRSLCSEVRDLFTNTDTKSF